MLVLTRRINEQIIIGNNLVTIKVLSFEGDCVRLGFEASKELSVHREEIFHKINGTKFERPQTPRPVTKKVVRTISQPLIADDGCKNGGNR